MPHRRRVPVVLRYRGLRVRVDGGPAGDICWTACRSCAVGWVPLRSTLDAVELARDHREHLGLPRLPVFTDRRRAADLLDCYFHRVRADRSGPLHPGGMFDRLGGGGDRPDVRDVSRPRTSSPCRCSARTFPPAPHS